MFTKPLDASTAIFWGEFVEVAYLTYSDNPGNPNPPKHSDFPTGWNLLANLTVDPRFSIFSDVEFIGFLVQSADDPTEFGVVFRGTETDMDWILNFEFELTPFADIPNGGRTELGFTSVYHSIKARVPGDGGGATTLADAMTRITSGASVTLTGHSLGGALAILHAAVLANQDPSFALSLYTFAAPMVGDEQFVRAFHSLVPDSYRYHNLPDVVPGLPGLLLGYRHVPTGIEIDSLWHLNIAWSVVCFHSILVYLYVLGSRKYGLGSCESILNSSRARPTTDAGAG